LRKVLRYFGGYFGGAVGRGLSPRAPQTKKPLLNAGAAFAERKRFEMGLFNGFNDLIFNSFTKN
jgi:hypothetical protein